MNKYICGLVAALALVSLPTQASVTVIDQSYNEHNGNFTMTVQATEQWCVWRTVDFVHWVKVSPIYQAGRRNFTDRKVGRDLQYAFYMAVPASGQPGNHYGWE